MKRPWVLGISASHNGAFCLLHGNEVIVAVQEERLIRRKRSRVYGANPSLALTYCLNAAGIALRDLSLVVLSPQGSCKSPEQDISLNPDLRVILNSIPTLYVSHHLAHAMSAYSTSGFSDAAVLVVDGVGSPYADMSVGEQRVARGAAADGWETVSTYWATPGGLDPIDKQLAPNGDWVIMRADRMWGFRSLGGLYSSAAEQMFGDPLEAGKVMGLVPYGKPSMKVDDFLGVADGLIEFKDIIPDRFAHKHRWPLCNDEYVDLAASTQRALEVALLELIQTLRSHTDGRNLCYAGGVALNGIANQRIIAESAFADVHIIPAAEDSGAAIGAAYWGLLQLEGTFRGRRHTSDSYGRAYSASHIDAAIANTPEIEVMPAADLLDAVTTLLCNGQIGGWFMGGSELGPRALGQRSILCDPRRHDAKDILNKRIKNREAFRPYAPAIRIEHVGDWFDLKGTPVGSPFMLRVCELWPDKRAMVPGVVHVDGTGRMQTVDSSNCLYDLIGTFHSRTGVPMLLNTSFNVMGEPIVETPEDALWSLVTTGLDFCVVENRLVRKGSSYRGLLDMVPRVIASSCTLEIRVEEHRLNLGGQSGLRFTVSTPWGETEQSVLPRYMRVVRLIDGHRTGWQLLDATGYEFNEESLVEALTMLGRLRIIEMKTGEQV